MRKSALAAVALSIACGPAVHDAQADTTKLTAIARIASYFRMQVEHQSAWLIVTAGDLERGYVDVPAASSFSVVTNTPLGFLVDFRPRGDVFLSVLVTGLQNMFEIGAHGGTALDDAARGRTSRYQLGYRFTLRPDLQPGSYPWPLEISVRSA